MIITSLNGGLGNQMFQYALGRKLALENKLDLVFDATSFEKNHLRDFNLGQFNVVQRIATEKELTLFGIKQETELVEKIYFKIVRKLFQPLVIRETQFHFDPGVLKNVKKYKYLDGYWQTEKYFSDIRDVLIRDFEIRTPLANGNLQIADHIRSVNSVSLHIRRGDYVSDTKILDVHGVCSLDYYYSAISHVSEKTDNPVLFIFSDDMQWVRENLRTSLETVYVDVNNADTSYEDMRLMSLCKHNIIANSSFSWWGAWLNANASKIVIAPQKWFNNFNADTKDLYPQGWIKIKN